MRLRLSLRLRLRLGVSLCLGMSLRLGMRMCLGMSMHMRLRLGIEAVDCAGYASTAQRLRSCTRGRGHSDHVAVARVDDALDAVARGQERVEALDKARVAAKQGRHTLNHARRIDRLALELVSRYARPS